WYRLTPILRFHCRNRTGQIWGFRERTETEILLSLMMALRLDYTTCESRHREGHIRLKLVWTSNLGRSTTYSRSTRTRGTAINADFPGAAVRWIPYGNPDATARRSPSQIILFLAPL